MQIKEEISRRKYFELNENTTYQNLWDTAKEVLRGTVIASKWIRVQDTSMYTSLA